MAERRWTGEQLSAIETRDRTLLVSAAAGSGKTATLTERIIRSLTDEKNPVDIESLLVVTFTNAAARELRAKISKALSEAVEKNPENKVIVTDRNNVALPTTTITCYKCGGTKGYWWTVQTRSADEAPTNFIRCAKCGNTWRSSN